ncbi:variable surface lipoprotein [Mycoplasma bovis]|nr:variable surface lipoprotein [Mycoplasmopsis bovis]
MKKTNKIIISLSSIISISSMPLIAASCQNKNRTDESIINNITPPQTIDNQKQQEDKSKEEKPNGSGNSSPNTTPQTQDNQNHQEDNIKEKEQSDDPSGSGNSSPNTTPQTQDNQNHQEDNIKEKEQSDDPRDLLEQLEKIRKDYEKTEKENENLIKNSNYSDVLNNWFGDIYRGRLGHKWNYYLQFKNIVEKRQKPESWFKTVKEFIEEYKTEIEKDLKEQKLI